MSIRFNARTSTIELDATSTLTFPASTTNAASLNIAEGVAPSAPVDGDVWVTAAGEFFARLNGSSVDLAAGGGGGNVSKVGTPVDNQIGVWTGDGTIEGDANFTWDGTAHALTIGDGTDSTAMSIASDTLTVGGTGLSFIRIQPSAGTQSIVAATGGSVTLYQNGNATLRTEINRSESVNSISGVGGGAFERVLTTADLEAGQPRLRYLFDTPITATDPTAGYFKMNNATPASVTAIYVSDTSDNGLTNDYVLSNLANGDVLTIVSEGDAADYIIASVNGAPTDNTGWWTIPVTIIDSGTLFADNSDIINFDVQWLSQAGGTTAQDETAADATSSATVLDGESNARNVGFNESVETALSTTGTVTPFTQARVGKTIYWTGGTATNFDTYANTGTDQTDIPAGAMWFVQNNGAGTLTFRGGTSVTIRYWSGAGAAPADVDVTIARGGVATVRKVSDTVYDIWGVGLS